MKIIRNFLKKIVFKHPALFFVFQLLQLNKVGSVQGTIGSVHDLYKIRGDSTTIALDLGCGPTPSNKFGADEVHGLDLVENIIDNIKYCRLGFEKLPFDDSTFDYVTAYDLIEHIPRYSENSTETDTPLIFLMNEVFRVLKVDGIFLSSTPIYPYFGAFQDPTHNNIITVDTFKMYFSKESYSISKHYGVTAKFQILYQKMYFQHLVAVLKKDAV
jgi:SAM-dependent methyltransferase